ncbi:Flp pilus assembly protein CpaB [Aeromonas hydrophila]|uniref:Flp pilus assembly protein CpaB n=2 Tax=Aeromonas hydrophila TaxID=644 RepID=A0KI89_AERHH|nr:Flp pilus assembly protein CpaB [Aeromonas hydrophila]ABK37960.1 Flp pilus assembly protein CpaB [Aeromonas hydrophila subsp. hydrophila ATCC 7966]MBS4670660.1 Flp pilus assembly protein CpaB [Aeromonas hydrophila]OOD30572.1 Flp pilus assembly protein CpaB [Aeromonas hydrophila]SUU24175.1 Flp pilus assembly protein CpaB [Aeromonas hydrophila]HEG4445078.1 Flp pilus assembly protein CpaB [Aeromonas hydrophila]
MKKFFSLIAALLVLAAMLAAFWPVEPAPQTAVPPGEQAPEPAASARLAQVLVAAHRVQAGAFIHPEDLVWQTLPAAEEMNLPGLFLFGFTDTKALKGSLVTRTLEAGQIVSADDLVRPEQSHYLSAMMAPGMRAVTLALGREAASHGLIRPGNRVDVILTSKHTHQRNAQGAEVTSKQSAEIILTDIKLLAIDAQVTDIAALNGTVAAQDNFDQVAVTFELAPSAAARLLLAHRLGELALVLRSAQAAPTGSEAVTLPAGSLIWAEQVARGQNPRALPGHGVRISYGDGNDRNRQP